MSVEELLRFCEKHNVKVTFSYDNIADIYKIRMERDFFRIDKILTIDQIYSSSTFSLIIYRLFSDMLYELNKGMEKNNDQT